LSARRAGRPWLIVAALFMVTYGVSTPLAAYGVFLPVLADTFGWSRGAIATALSLNLIVGGFVAFGIGSLADRYGPRVLLAVTAAIAGTSFALISTVHTLWQLYLYVSALGAFGLAGFYVLTAATVTHWFHERRGLAIALSFVGFNVGYMTAGPLAAALIAAVGWRAAYALLAGGGGLLAVLAALTVRYPRPGEVATPPTAEPATTAPGIPSGATLAEAMRDPRLWCLGMSWLLLGGLILMLGVHIVPFARDRGIDLATAALALTAYGLGSVIGRLAAGVVSDRLGTLATLWTGFAALVVSLVVLLAVPSPRGLITSLVGFGIGAASTDTMFVKIIAEVFGLRALGGVIGILSLGWRTGAALGPAAAGFLYDVTGSYAVPFGVTPIVVVISWVLSALGSRRRRA
jgi:MFS family permease